MNSSRNKNMHKQVYESLREERVLVNLHYIPVYCQPYYEQLGFRRGYCPNAEEYYSSILTIPTYIDLSEKDQNQVVDNLKRVPS